MKITKQELVWKIICTVICLLMVPLIIFNLILSIQGASSNDKLPSVFGISPTVVGSGSMSPEFEAKDLIFIKEVDTSTLVEKEDVICFINDDGNFITHRINRIIEVDGEKRFYTKGDANNAEDIKFVLSEQIQGVYVGKISKFGGVIMFMQTPHGIILVIILLLMIFIAGELLVENVIRRKENILLSNENEKLLKENERLKNLKQSEQKACEIATVAEETVATETVEEIIVTETIEEKEDVYEQPHEEVKAIVVEETEIANELENEESKTVVELEAVDNGFDLNDIHKQKIAFSKRLLKLDIETQEFFANLHNELISYKKVSGRISFKGTSYRTGRKLLAKFTVRGKTLTLHLALDVEAFDKNVYFQKNMSEIKAYELVPFAVKVKSNRGVKNATKLIEAVMRENSIAKRSKFVAKNVLAEISSFK